MSGFIYAVESGGRIKLGFSEKPELRFNKIAADAPFPCVLLGYWPGDISDELAVHAKFNDVRVHGEWFAATADLLAFVADNAMPRDTQSKRYAITGDETPLLAWRKARRERVEEFAAQIGISKGMWSRWETGKNKIGTRHIHLVRKLTGLTLEQLRPDLFEAVQ